MAPGGGFAPFATSTAAGKAPLTALLTLVDGFEICHVQGRKRPVAVEKHIALVGKNPQHRACLPTDTGITFASECAQRHTITNGDLPLFHERALEHRQGAIC